MSAINKFFISFPRFACCLNVDQNSQMPADGSGKKLGRRRFPAVVCRRETFRTGDHPKPVTGNIANAVFDAFMLLLPVSLK
jgi:hypothetical protein